MTQPGQDVHTYIKGLKEPLPIQPFLDWCERRETYYSNDLNAGLVAKTHRAADSDYYNNASSPLSQLLADIGWHAESGVRRLHRWRHENTTGHVERAQIEDALHHAGVGFDEVYPDHDDSTDVELVHIPSGTRIGLNRHMTDQQVCAAHVVYWQTNLSLRQMGELLWEKYNYANAESCAWQLRRAFKNLGLPRRDNKQASFDAHYKHGMNIGGKSAPGYKRYLKLQANGQCDLTLSKTGSPCPRAAKPGTTRCGYHQPAEMERRKTQLAEINAQGRNTLRWANRTDQTDEADRSAA